MNHQNKKILVAVLLTSFLALAVPQLTHAFWFECLPDIVSCGITGISSLINSLAGLLVALAAWCMRIALVFNEGIPNSPAVQAGFGIALALANLGFVLAIIVIAIATILRSQSYGLKQILWKLVVAAIIVNFSLVIAAAILGLADSFTHFFLNAISPTQNGEFLGAGYYDKFIFRLTAAFQPQTFYSPPTGRSALTVVANGLSSWTSGILGAIMSIAFLLIIAFTFEAFAILLLVRYVYIGILLILAPLAWLAWIFPNLKQHFSKWWSDFFRWTFFPPIVMFFLYLAILTGTGGNRAPGGYLNRPDLTSATGAAGQITEVSTIQTATQNAGLTDVIASDIIMIALALGGLFAANSLSLKGASTVMGAVKSANSWVGGYVGKQAKKGGRWALRTAEEKTNRGEGKGGIISRMTNSRIRPIAIAGRAAFGASKNADLVKAEEKNIPKNPMDIKRNIAQGSMKKEGLFANIAQLVKDGELSNSDLIQGKKAAEWKDSYEKDFEAYGQGKLLKDMDKVLMSDKAMRDAAGKNDATALNDAAKNFLEKMKKEDMKKINLNEIDWGEKLGRAIILNMAKFTPQLAASMLSKMNGKTIKKFSDEFDQEIGDEGKRILERFNRGEITGDQTKTERKKLEEIEERIKKTITNNLFSGGGETAEASPPPPAEGATT